ncbi:MAG: two-component system response regulator [Alkalinema sp. CACIAM 70d]|nr:MAG: two-component system response regulator [Alkalinema sp. CACIAM 70d]
MNTLPSVSYRSFERLHPLNLLAQLSSRQTTGRLQVTSEATVWSIYLDRGQLTYATNLVDPFGRLERHLGSLAAHIPSLTAEVREEMRSRFEHTIRTQSTIEPDYRAICWLVDQGYLTNDDAIALIENLAKEVLAGFLEIKTGHFAPIDNAVLSQAPIFGRLELRPLVEHCQTQIRQRQNPASAVARSTPSALRLTQLSPDPSAPSANSVTDQPPNPLEPSRTKDHYTIVCIDDSPTVLQAINCFLDDQNFSVIMINDPVKALMQVVRSKPDLILLDVGMPNLDGYELCSLLRRHPSSKNIPIIMVTGHTGFIDRAKAKLVGASGYLTKPFNQADLLKTVFKHLT